MFTTSPKCAECGATEHSHGAWRLCADCEEYFCGYQCYNAHIPTCEKIKAQRKQSAKWRSFEEEEPRSTGPRCSECGRTVSSRVGGYSSRLCTLCINVFCLTCYPGHRQKSHAKQEQQSTQYAWTCWECKDSHTTCYQPTRCPECKYIFCMGCILKHKAEHEREKAYSATKCSFCGTHEIDTLMLCQGCRRCFCENSECMGIHRAKCNWNAHFTTNSTNQQQEAFSFEENMRKIFEELRRAEWRSSATGSFSSSQEYFSRNGTTNSTQHTSTIPREVRDALTLLGLTGTPTAEQIKQAYRKKAQEAHPDKGGSHEQMVKINKAKEKALKWAK